MPFSIRCFARQNMRACPFQSAISVLFSSFSATQALVFLRQKLREIGPRSRFSLPAVRPNLQFKARRIIESSYAAFRTMDGGDRKRKLKVRGWPSVVQRPKWKFKAQNGDG